MTFIFAVAFYNGPEINISAILKEVGMKLAMIQWEDEGNDEVCAFVRAILP